VHSRPARAAWWHANQQGGGIEAKIKDPDPESSGFVWQTIIRSKCGSYDVASRVYIGNTTCVHNLVKRVIEMDPQLYVAAVRLGVRFRITIMPMTVMIMMMMMIRRDV
jgi:hypothetical protein